jgi:uncharacterized protein
VVGQIRVEVIQAWPRRYESAHVNLPEGATVAQAIAAAGLTPADHVGIAVHGEMATNDRPLRDGDRVELLRPLTIDPKEARRRRAGA